MTADTRCCQCYHWAGLAQLPNWKMQVGSVALLSIKGDSFRAIGRQLAISDSLIIQRRTSWDARNLRQSLCCQWHVEALRRLSALEN